jgi:hypothetical protein
VIDRLTKLLEIESDYWKISFWYLAFGDPENVNVAGSSLQGEGWEKEKSHGIGSY